MEWFDIVDERGVPTGQTVERARAHELGIRHRTAHIWVVRKKDGRYEVLLQKRSKDKDSFPGKLDTSSSGHISAGDAPLTSALRELAEELGIHAEPDELVFIGNFRIQYEKEFHGHIFRDNEVAFVYLCIRRVELLDLHLQLEEVEQADWFDLEQVRKARAENDPAFCVPRESLELLWNYLNR